MPSDPLIRSNQSPGLNLRFDRYLLFVTCLQQGKDPVKGYRTRVEGWSTLKLDESQYNRGVEALSFSNKRPGTRTSIGLVLFSFTCNWRDHNPKHPEL